MVYIRASSYKIYEGLQAASLLSVHVLDEDDGPVAGVEHQEQDGDHELGTNLHLKQEIRQVID